MNSYGHADADVIMFDFTLGGEGEGYLVGGRPQPVCKHDKGYLAVYIV